MSQVNRGIRAFKTGAGISTPLPAYTRVKQVASADANGFTGTVLLAGAFDQEVGVTEAATQQAGNHVAVALPTMSGSRKIFCASICSIKDRLYAAANGQVDTMASSGVGTAGGAIGALWGIAIEAIEACNTAGGVVEAIPVPAGEEGFESLLFVATGDSSGAGTGVNTEAFFDTNTFTIPANTLKKGDILRIKARAVATATHSADTFAFKLYLGAVNVAAPAAFDAANSDEILVDATVIVTDIGAAGHVKAFILQATGAPGTAAVKENTLASTAIDTTAAAIIRASITVSAADAGNTAVLRDLVVEFKRQ